jgi:hypothetical protein
MQKIKKWFIADNQYQQGERLRNVILVPAVIFGLFLTPLLKTSDGRASDFACANVENKTQCFDLKTKKVYVLVNNQYHLVK